MDAHISPSRLTGSVDAIASKSCAHRLLILSAFADNPGEVRIGTSSTDIEATRACLAALWSAWHGGYTEPVVLPCQDSGSTLRFLLPVVGALGISCRFERKGRLASRPLAPLDAALCTNGMTLTDEGEDLLVSGSLRAGTFTLPGNVSSQYISGLLMAAPLLDGPTQVLVRKPVESRPYIVLTVDALAQFGVTVKVDTVKQADEVFERFSVVPSKLLSPHVVEAEGDWSAAAFWLAAGSMEDEGIAVTNLNLHSAQGDRGVLAALALFGARIARRDHAARATRFAPQAATIDVSAIPDLVPPLAAVAATLPGTTRLCKAGRLRLKESDRLATVSAAVNALGGKAEVTGDDLVIQGVKRLRGGTMDACGDHRIAMMGAVMATHATHETTITGAQCVAKSYPGFWDDYAALGGKIELA